MNTTWRINNIVGYIYISSSITFIIIVQCFDYRIILYFQNENFIKLFPSGSLLIFYFIQKKKIN
ncbi:hypothetical protein DERP_001297 [Dermatophagoides pteronyssinus]|uniref:Uncharacterized protein n=1 Tax=Dermatophagoides pteronyssinus TaxID=6956 RepID=A0ABQ8JE38_DERPT|nr:hypothetical protein DERP_001297 [Dermatophagoides pteronyssinus]